MADYAISTTNGRPEGRPHQFVGAGVCKDVYIFMR